MKKNNKIFWFLFLLIVSLSFFLISCFHLEPDYFWHIKAGEYMMRNHLLREDVFSWFLSHKYWMSHEWLFEIIIYYLKTIFGNYHILVYLLFSLVGLSSLLYFPNHKGFFRNYPFSLLFIAFYTIMMVFYVQARPHLISLCLFATTIWFLVDLYHHKESKKIYFLPLISILWANIHGGSSNLVYLLCFLFFIGGLFSFQFKKIEAKRMSKVQLRKYFWVMVLCMIGVCINLHGFKMFLYPYQNMLDHTMLENIQEWQGTTLNDWSHYIYFAFIVFVLFTYLFSERKIQWMDLLLTGFVFYLGLKSIRFWSFGPIALSYILFDYVKERKIENGTYLGIVVLSCFFFALFVSGFSHFVVKDYYVYLNSDIISLLKKEKPNRLFNMYDYGGELVYYDIPVFIDSRADLYSPYNYEDYLDISLLKKDSLSLIDKYDFDYLLVDEEYPIYTYLENDSQYEVLYHTDTIVLFKKN